MESMAITANQLENIPINSLKGFLGHTLGAAGVLETILSGVALLDNMLLKSNGSENRNYLPFKYCTEQSK